MVAQVDALILRKFYSKLVNVSGLANNLLSLRVNERSNSNENNI